MTLSPAVRLHTKVLDAGVKQAEKKMTDDLRAIEVWLNKARDHCNRQVLNLLRKKTVAMLAFEI